MSSQKKKVTLYFNAAMLSETQKEALRQDRSVSWIIQAAWRIARDEIRRMPGALSTGLPSSGHADADSDRDRDSDSDSNQGRDTGNADRVAAAQAGSASLSGSAPRPV
jgi:uncharacterized small protein (TIGR04563 family)